MFKIPWKIVLIVSIIALLFAALISLIANKHGSYSTINSDLIGEDKLINTRIKTDEKFESKGEGILRNCLENLYALKFPNVRLSEIVNPNTGMKLEIDCYNEQLKIGAEYHGINHYKFIPHFHKTEEAFKESQKRDEYKELMCAKLGITLLIVPYNTNHDKICDFVKRELKKRNLLQHLYGW
jgi:hypothetical protein